MISHLVRDLVPPAPFAYTHVPLCFSVLHGAAYREAKQMVAADLNLQAPDLQGCVIMPSLQMTQPEVFCYSHGRSSEAWLVYHPSMHLCCCQCEEVKRRGSLRGGSSLKTGIRSLTEGQPLAFLTLCLTAFSPPENKIGASSYCLVNSDQTLNQLPVLGLLNI